MGSKTPHNDGDRQHHTPPMDGSNDIRANGNPTGPSASDGDGCLGSNGAGDGSDDDDDDDVADPVQAATATITSTPSNTKIKKKRRSKKSKKKSTTASKQTSPPTIPITQLFPDANYPPGQVLEYPPHIEGTRRTTATELRHSLRQNLDDPVFLSNYRHAAEVHRQTRSWVRSYAQPGTSLSTLASGIDDSIRSLLSNPGVETESALKSGIGFPTGLSVNEIVAHWTPTPGKQDVLLKQSDVLKVDFGVHVNGWIVDSAFTLSWDPVYDALLEGVRAATEAGIKEAGPDIRITAVTSAIQEVMESHEVVIGGKTYPVKPVRSLSAHDIRRYQIHGGKSIPFVRSKGDEFDGTRMEEGEVYAIETFGTTGRGWLRDGEGVYGYGIPYTSQTSPGTTGIQPPRPSLALASANKLYNTIRQNFGTIVFSRRQLEHLGCERYLAGLNALVRNGYLDEYKPLVDAKGSYSAQFEHTILLRENCKEVVSRGDDY